MELSEGAVRRLRASEPVVGWAGVLMLPLGLLGDLIIRLTTPGSEEFFLLCAQSLFFALIVLRLGLAVVLSPGRRLALLLLLAALTIWAAGSVIINAAKLDDQEIQFPAPGEVLCLVAYIPLAAYLLLDVDRRLERPARAWLDMLVVGGGTYCVAALLLITPIQVLSGLEGLPLLLALIYPLIDIALALVVLGQVIVQVRSDRTKSAMLGIALLLWAAADSGFALQRTDSSYDYSNTTILIWGSAFVLLVGGACRPDQQALRAVPRSPGTTVLVSAGAAALAVLTFRPDDALTYYTMPAALLTMFAVAGRMALALRDANRASEAFALSQTDDLTKLPNRRAVRAWLAEALGRDEPLALMLLDLDRFKEINDSLGHRAGDTVLTLVAVRVREAVETDTRVARLGGDEFAILVDVTAEHELQRIAEGVLAELAKPIVVDDLQISPSGSIGIAVAGPDDEDSNELLRRADVAMYQAKGTERGVATYDAELDGFSRHRLQLAEELRVAIAEQEIEVWYQPKIHAKTHAISGLEALVRWQHPERGVVSPDAFLQAARRAGLMGQLSDIVVRRAIADLQHRREIGIEVPVAINCAPPELLGSTFLPQLYASMEEMDVPAGLLVLEVTEETFLADPQRAQKVLLELRDHGVQISIDDYGTGFSSLTYLRNLPIQELKIDRSLIDEIATDRRTQSIVASTIQLAHALDMRIVAEGVEKVEDLEVLVKMGIDVVQGYYFARPMPHAELIGWVRAWSTTDALATQPD